jgi:hypothetical protein
MNNIDKTHLHYKAFIPFRFIVKLKHQANTIITLSWYFTIGHKNKGNIRISLSWYFTIGQYNQGNTRISLSWYFYNWTIKPGQYMYITLPELYN